MGNPHRVPGFDWEKDDNLATLRRLWVEEKLTAAQLGRVMGITRNSVLAKVNRLKKYMDGPEKILWFRGSSSGPRRSLAAGRMFESAPRKLPPIAEHPVMKEPLRLEDGAFVTLDTVSDRTCRFPIGDPCKEDFHFCGQAPKLGAPYCDAHQRMTHTVMSPRSSRG